MIEVKICVVPGNVYNVALEDGATISDALTAGSVDNSENWPITVNGAAAGLDTILAEGARIILAKSAKSAV